MQPILLGEASFGMSEAKRRQVYLLSGKLKVMLLLGDTFDSGVLNSGPRHTFSSFRATVVLKFCSQ